MKQVTFKDTEINPNLLWEIIYKSYILEHKTLKRVLNVNI